MKEVNIYIQESCDSMNTKNGQYTAIMTTQGKKVQISNTFTNTTNYRMIIQGAIDAISKLNQPCVVNLFTNTPFGMSKIRKSDGVWYDCPEESINSDLLNELKAVVVDGGHELNNFYNKDLVVEAFSAYKGESLNNHVILRLPDKLYNRLNDRCKQEGTNANDFIKSLLDSVL